MASPGAITFRETFKVLFSGCGEMRLSEESTSSPCSQGDESEHHAPDNLLKDMATHTQFVVITHAKRTMEVAQSLYGVTMQEPGVSKLVSVRFQPLPEQAEQMALASAGRN